MAFRNFGSSCVIKKKSTRHKKVPLSPSRVDCVWSKEVTGRAKSQTQIEPPGIVCGREESKNMLLLPTLRS